MTTLALHGTPIIEIRKDIQKDAVQTKGYLYFLKTEHLSFHGCSRTYMKKDEAILKTNK